MNRAVYRELGRHGWSVEIAIPDRRRYATGLLAPDPPLADDPLLHPLRPTSGNQRLHTFHGLIPLLEKTRPRIIYVDNDPASILTVEAGIWARCRGAAVVCQSCDNLSRAFGPSFARAGLRGLVAAGAIRLLAMAAAPNVRHIFSINTEGLSVYAQLGFHNGISHIPLGFDPRLFHRDPAQRDRTRKALGLNSPTIAFFGMLRPAKGVHLLIEALEGLLSYDWQLIIDRFDAFRDPYTGWIENLLKTSPVSPRVVFFDATHSQMPDYMNAADIAVLPSVSTPIAKEQYGRAASEAMACGCMVIVSNSGALPELVGEAGIRIPENDVPSLREALRRGVQDAGLRNRLGDEAFRRAHSSLSIQQQAEIMSTTFRAVLSEPRK